MSKWVSLVRSSLVGPVLNRLSRLEPEELSNLLLASTSDLPGRSVPSAEPSGAVPRDVVDTLEALKEQQAQLKERIDVLERMIYKPRT